jgi:hypothetical protein
MQGMLSDLYDSLDTLRVSTESEARSNHGTVFGPVSTRQNDWKLQSMRFGKMKEHSYRDVTHP